MAASPGEDTAQGNRFGSAVSLSDTVASAIMLATAVSAVTTPIMLAAR